MKTVLLLLGAGSGREGCLQAAIDLTRALHGHLTCVDESAASPAGRSVPEDVPCDWITAAGSHGRPAAATVDFADILVTNPPASNLFDPALPRVAADIAAGRDVPVLVVPSDRTGLDVAGNALVAWDGSRAALAALRCGIPLLALSRQVTLLEIDDRRLGPPAEVAAQYLSRHGIAAAIDRVHSLHRPTADLIEAHAASLGAAYIVMGAYGHNRTRELFFGGVTRSMLDRGSYPLLLAH